MIGFFGVMSPVVGRVGWSLRSFLPKKSYGKGRYLSGGELKGCFTGTGQWPMPSSDETRVLAGVGLAPLGLLVGRVPNRLFGGMV